MPKPVKKAGEKHSLLVFPSTFPYSKTLYARYLKLVKQTGGQHDGWEAIPNQLFYWWAYYPSKAKIAAAKAVFAKKRAAYIGHHTS